MNRLPIYAWFYLHGLNRRLQTWPKLNRWLPWLVFAICLGVTYQLRKSEQQDSLRDLQTDFDFRARETAVRVEQRMQAYEQELRGVQGLFASTGGVERSARIFVFKSCSCKRI